MTETADLSFQFPEDQESPEPVMAKPPQLEGFFRAMTRAGASDLHLKAEVPPHVRLGSRLRPTKSKPPTSAAILAMAVELMTQQQKKHFEERGSVDLAYEVPDGDRFRINVFRQRGLVSLAARRVTRDIPDFEQLHLPPLLGKIAQEHQGLVLLAGGTGSGKTTTIASMIQYINQTRRCHVVTIEDPIEYLFIDQKALINQREVGLDVLNFDEALKYLLRQDPDVVLIGEMRDEETFHAALQASETGHMVFGTVHASGASQAIGRILDLFPLEARDRIRQSLSFNLKAIICQMLLPCIAEGHSRVPAVEILLMDPTVRQLVQEARDTELPDVIRAHERDGMQSFTKSLMDLINNDYIDPKVAYEVAPNVEELKMLMKGISTAHGGLIGRR